MRYTLAALLLLAGCQKDRDKKDPSGTAAAAKTATARYHVVKLASEGFPLWSVKNPSLACPSSIDEIAAAAETMPVDPWGNPYFLFCGDGLPPGVTGVGVMSFGPDGTRDTADDIASWKQ